MSKAYHWLALWDFESSRWKPLGWRRTFPETADLVPPMVRLSGVVHLSTVVCRSSSPLEAELAFAKLPPPPKVGGVDPVRRYH